MSETKRISLPPSMRTSMVVSHRGRTVDSGSLDNTLEAFEKAIGRGAEMIEFDVRRTKDGELILNHDPDIGGRLIAEMTYAELKTWEHGAHVATLKETARLTAGRVLLDVELKEGGYEAEVLGIVRKYHNLDQFVVTSFLDKAVARTKQLAPEACVGLLVGHSTFKQILHTRVSDFFPLQRLKNTKADFLACSYPLADLGVARPIMALGIPVVVWTVNDVRRLRRHLHDVRIAAVISDVPEVALDHLGSHSEKAWSRIH